MNRLFSLSLLLLVVAPCLTSQAQSSSDRVEVTFTAVSLAGPIGKLDYINSSQLETIHIVHGLRTNPVKYRGPRTMPFYAHGNTQESDVKIEELPPLATVTFPSSGNYLLLFAKNGSQLKILPTPSNIDDFKPGMYRFVNMAPFDLALRVGDASGVVSSNTYFDVDASSGQGRSRRAMIYSLLENQEPRRSFTGGLEYDEGRRMIYIITGKPGGRPGRINIIPIIDSVES
ncbi:MAG: hypothetical protein ACPGN3_12695 [Opitutales bacterium]